MDKKETKYIFVVGGVISGVGKGITSSSLGLILKNRGLNVTSIKIDPYINVDAGTMNLRRTWLVGHMKSPVTILFLVLM